MSTGTARGSRRFQEVNVAQGSHLVAVVGAGPAGLFASKVLASNGVQVALLNRDIKPGGLAEYGIYYDKHKMKEGLRKQFRQILDNEAIHYFGNVKVGKNSGLSLEELLRMGFDAVLVTVGAQGTKLLGLPGEELRGVYHAKDIVYHYNQLPPFGSADYAVCCRVALVGVGNVMLDIAHWVIRDLKVDEVIAVARRGPAEVKFSKKEMEIVAANLDLQAFDAEMRRVAPMMEAVGQDVQTARDYILAALPKAQEAVSRTRLRFDFLASPTRIVGDEYGNVIGLEVEDTTLVADGSDTKARGLGSHRILDVEAVIFCIGDRVDENFGLPVSRNEFVKNPNPSYPVDGLSYEAYDPTAAAPIQSVFVAGWSREASSGLVGVARKDGECGAQALLQYLRSLERTAQPEAVIADLERRLQSLGGRVIVRDDLWILDAIEKMEAKRRGLDYYKMRTNEEMLAALESN
jgi:ferredoxin--NADP+ reductase